MIALKELKEYHLEIIGRYVDQIIALNPNKESVAETDHILYICHRNLFQLRSKLEELRGTS